MTATTIAWATANTATGTTWTNNTNANGANNATVATFTSVVGGAVGYLQLTGYNTSATNGGVQPTTVDSVQVTVYNYVGQANRWTSASAQLYDGTGTAIGTSQALTLTTSTTNAQTVTFTGVTWAQIASNLQVRVSAIKSGTVSNTFNVDAVGVVVNYTVLAPPTVDAGTDATVAANATFTRTAIESGGAAASRAWTILSGPTGVGSTLGTTTALSWTPTTIGSYVLRYSATNAAGTGTGDVTVVVYQLSTVTGSTPISGGLTGAGVSSVTIPYTESFTGADGSPWSSIWVGTSGGSSSIQGNRGMTTSPVDTWSAQAQYFTGMGAIGDTDVTGTVAAQTFGAVQYACISINSDIGGIFDWGGANCYLLYLDYAGDQYYLAQNFNGTYNTLGTPFSRAIDGQGEYSFRFQRVGQVLRAKVWDTIGETEPVTWGTTYTLPGTPLTGFVALAGAKGEDASTRSFYWDNITVSVPITLPYTATFTGTDGSALPYPWTTTVGTTSIQSNSAFLTPPSGGYTSARADLGILPLGDMDITGTITPTVNAVEEFAAIAINSDGTSPGNPAGGHSYALFMNFAGTLWIRVYDGGSGSDTFTDYSNTGWDYSWSATWSFRLQRVGSLVRGRVWAGGPEPSTWHVTYTITGTPFTGIPSINFHNPADGTVRTASYDNITVSVPSTGPTYDPAQFMIFF